MNNLTKIAVALATCVICLVIVFNVNTNILILIALIGAFLAPSVLRRINKTSCPLADTPVQKQTESLHKMPQSLGLIIGVLAVMYWSSTRTSAALIMFVGYMIGASLGYGIQQIPISSRWRTTLVVIIVVMFMLAKAVIETLSHVQ